MDDKHTPCTAFPDGRPESEQPKWRRDFPIDVEADEYGARRDFTKFMVLTSLAFACGQFWIALQSLFRGRKICAQTHRRGSRRAHRRGRELSLPDRPRSVLAHSAVGRHLPGLFQPLHSLDVSCSP